MGNIKGITIEIDGKTTGLTKALEEVNRNIKSVSGELREVNQLLKLDPGNTELIAQKQKLLSQAIEETTQKLSTLKKAKSEADQQFKEGKISEEQYRALDRELIKTEQSLSKLNSELGETDKASKKVDMGGLENQLKGVGKVAADIADKIGKVTLAVGATMGALTLAAGAAALKLGKEVVKQFGELEQNLGGSEAVFASYAERIQKIGEDAYKNMGTSQSQYLATANKMGALFQGSGLSQEKSFDLTTKAMQRAADMASVMGIDMQMALDSVAGAAKGNFTMMDNLGVAMNATNIEAYALANGLEFTWSKATQAEKAEMAMKMFFENTEQYAGNFAKESTTTVTGALGLMEAAFTSFMGGLGNVDADMANLTKNLVDAFSIVVDNVIPIIDNLVQALPAAFDALIGAAKELLPTIIPVLSELLLQLIEAVVEIIPSLIDTLITTMISLAPMLLQAVFNIITALVEAVSGNITPIVNMVVTLLSMMVNFFLDNIVMLLEVGVKILIALVQGIVKELPTLIPKLIEVLLDIVIFLLDNIDLIIDIGIQILIALIEGIVASLPILIAKLPTIIESVVTTLITLSPKLAVAALQIVVALAGGLIKALPQIWAATPKIWQAVFDGIMNGVSNMQSIGKNMVEGLWQGLNNSIGWIKSKITGWVGDVMKFLKKLFGIASPSKVMKKEIGLNLGFGVAEGIEGSIGMVRKAMGNLSREVEASVNPIINPTANSNPLILQIENFINERKTDVEAFMEEAEFYRRKALLAGGVK